MDATVAIARLKDRLGFDSHAIPAQAGTPAWAAQVAGQEREIIACLEVINRAANGEIPSNSNGTRRNRQVLDDASYWVSLIVSGGLRELSRESGRPLKDAEARTVLLKAVTSIAYAWSQVLAGDVDDLVEGLE